MLPPSALPGISPLEGSVHNGLAMRCLLKNRFNVMSSMRWVFEKRFDRRLKRARLSLIEELDASIRWVCALVSVCGSLTFWRLKASR